MLRSPIENWLLFSHYFLYNQRASTSEGSAASTPRFTGPLASLEQRQEDVLKRLETMQATVTQLEKKYKIDPTQSSPSSSSASSSSALTSGAGLPKFVGKPGRILDLAISADPSSVPLSLVALAEQVSREFPTLLSTFVHSSVASTTVPDRLQQLLQSNSGRSRADCQVAVTLVWKKVSHGPQLVVDPVHQTSIQGEANVARYLWGLLAKPGSDLDPARATLEDELVDLAQLQVLEGNNKERSAAVRRLNSVLGKQNSWLMGGDAPSLVDLVCWSALNQAGLVQGAPANVQRWLTCCKQHEDFSTAHSLVDTLSS
ncbi:aminoacyl tRNA synthase complex-interacting multifunctional protein 2-like [Elysia marginata]|uniref:Aminoacyl tRNA synthase complex-interacting multifunctional protein 2-like n=1 Tax=Elysia marginata TaxID=1093978 RepID=A0AAV4GUC8_9GAST|nr:aminoacyl tRNA synthase complex-interacting multifunctional protein 2-like [Elysia marginata]